MDDFYVRERHYRGTIKVGFSFQIAQTRWSEF